MAKAKYELTDEEVEFLVEALDAWYNAIPEPEPEDLKRYVDLRHYFMTGERR